MKTTAYAITDSDVQNAITAKGKDAVSGNVFIWFLCAIAFLKISQKIDSFMSGLGVNVGHTGGSMMSEALIAAKSLGAGGKGFLNKGFGGKAGTGSGSSDKGGFMPGGLASAVGRKITGSAMNSATDKGGGFFGKKAFEASMGKSGPLGGFAKNIISDVAKGDIGKTGSITGETAEKALSTYLGYGGSASGTVTGSETPSLPAETSSIGASAGVQPDISVSSGAIEPPGGGSSLSMPETSPPITGGGSIETGTPDKDIQPDMTGGSVPVGEPSVPSADSFESMPELPEIVPDFDGEDSGHPVTILPEEPAGISDYAPVAPIASDAPATFGHEVSASGETTESSIAVSAPEVSQPAISQSIGSSPSVSGSAAGTSVSSSSAVTQSTTVSNTASSTANTSASVSSSAATTQQEHINSPVSIPGDVPVSSAYDGGSSGASDSTQEMAQSLGMNNIPSFSNVEIGGGRITGTETSSEFPKGTEFAMYNAGQYMKPDGHFTTVKTVDGEKWYKQYAVPKVEKTPVVEEGGKIKYQEKIVNKLPAIPRRKDKV